MKILLTIAILIMFGSSLTYAEAPDRSLHDYTIPELIHYFAIKYSVSEDRISKTIQCESHTNPSIQSGYRYKKSDPKRGIVAGEQEKSFGLAMIHLPDHPEVTEDQAKDPVFAIEFMAKSFHDGNARWWVCWRNLYK